MLRDARIGAARSNNGLMAAAVSLLTVLSLVAGAVTAQASPIAAPANEQLSVHAKDPVDPPAPEPPAPEPPAPKAEMAPDRDRLRHAGPDAAIKASPIPQSATATAVEAPRMDVWLESREYYGQDTIYCYVTGLTLVQGRQYVICATMFPKDSAGNPTEFSPSNTIRLTVKDGCGATASDRTYYNIYTAGTSPNVLRGYTPIPSGVVSVPWGTCSTGWTITFTFSGSTLDGTPVNSSAQAQVDATPPPPPPALDPEQTRGGAGPWHAAQGDPVDSLTGAFNYHPDRPDLMYAARGEDLALSRSYASDVTRSNRFGPGWSDSYDASLTEDPATGSVTHHDPSGSVQKFTRSGTTYTAPLGVRSVLTKTAAGWNLQFKDQTLFTFDLTGTLTGITDRNNQGSTLSWANGKLASVSASGRTLTLSYNALGFVDQLTGSDGHSVSYQYDSSGRLQGFVDAAGFTTTYGYDGNGLLASIKDPNGNFPVRSNYDATSRRVIQQQDADGQISFFGWTQSGPDSRTGTGTVTDPRGFTVTDTYENGYLVTQSDADGKLSRFTWDASAQLSSTVDRLGNTTWFSYDGKGNLVSRRGPNNVIERYSYNARNDITEVTDFKGSKSTYSYDAAGNLETVSRASIAGGSGPVVSARYVYNTDGTLQSVADGLGRTTRYGYNGQGDLISTTTPEGRVTTSVIDAAGRVESIVEPRGNVAGANPDTYRTRLTWDKLDRVTSTTNPLGHATTTVFDPAGRVDHTIDAKGGRTSFTYGATGNPLSVQGPDLSVGPQRFTYDPNGNLESTTSPAGKTTTYTYTSGNARKTVSSGAGTWSYDYDAAGRLIKATAPSSRSVTLTRNPQGQVAKLTYSDGTPAVSFAYDASGSRSSMTDGQGTTSYSYNAINQLTSVSRSGTAQFLYTYDEVGQLSTRQIPDGSGVTQYTYDQDGRMTGVSAGNQTLATYTYDVGTGAVTTALPGGVTNILQIDAAGRPIQVKAQKGTTTLTRSQYSLDELGNPVQVQNTDGTTDSYAYSPLNRLTAACYGAVTCSADTSTAAFRYSYDPDGNITSVVQPTGTTTYTYDSAGRLSSRAGLKGAATYQYDADGNTTSDGTATYAWNAAGQLAKVTSGTSATSYSYDGDNHRVGVTAGRTTTTNTYDPISGALVLEQSGSKILRRYDYGTGLLSMKSGTSTSSYLTDALGSVRGVASSTGALSLSYSYNPYGDARATVTGKSAPENILQFTGAPLKAPLYQMGARDYSPADGRFLSPDPAGIPGRSYTYADANPMANTDPSGLSAYDWREMVNRLAGGIADVTGAITLACTVALVVCGQVVPVAGALSLVASAVSVATSDQTRSCLSGHSSCPEAIINGAIVAGAGRFGLGGKVARTIEVDSQRFGAAAEHLRDACGSSFCVTYDPAGKNARRAANMQKFGLGTKTGYDRDEAPPAVFKESEDASVRYVDVHSNRSLGGYFRQELDGLSPGDTVQINIK